MARNKKNVFNNNILLNYTIPIDGPTAPLPEGKRPPIVSEEEQQFLAKIAFFTFEQSKKVDTDRHSTPARIWILKGLFTSPSSYGTKVPFYAPGAEMHTYLGMVTYYVSHPLASMGAIYTQLLRPLDSRRQLHSILFQIPNIVIGGILVTGELVIKTLAAAFTRPLHALWQITKRSPSLLGKIGAGTAAVLIGGPLWLVGQVAFIPGNLLNYTRKAIDGAVNVMTSAIAWAKDRLTGSKDYGKKFPTLTASFKTIGKSMALTVGLGIPALRAVFDHVVKSIANTSVGKWVKNKLGVKPVESSHFKTEYSRNSHSRRKSSKNRSMISSDEIEPSQIKARFELQDLNQNDNNSHARQGSNVSEVNSNAHDSFKQSIVSVIEEPSTPPVTTYSMVSQSRESSQNSTIDGDKLFLPPSSEFSSSLVGISEGDNTAESEESASPTTTTREDKSVSREQSQNSSGDDNSFPINRISSLGAISEEDGRSSSASLLLRLSNGSTKGSSMVSDLPSLDNKLTRRYSDSNIFFKQAPANEAPVATADARQKRRKLSL